MMKASAALPSKVSRRKMAGFYFSRVVVHPVLRGLMVRLLQTWIGRHRSGKGWGSVAATVVKKEGVVKLNGVLNKSQCADILAYMADKPFHDRDSTASFTLAEQRPRDMAFGIHAQKDVIDCPHIMEFVSSPEIIDLAGVYLGCVPTLSCLGVQWSFPTESPQVAQKFHRDCEDWKYIRFIVYLTDVDEHSGPHVYIKGSHLDRLPLRLRFYSHDEIVQTYGAERVVKVLGRAGTCVVADTAGIHKGELPSESPRLILTMTYSILPIGFMQYRAISSRHAPHIRNYTNRLYLRRSIG